MGQLPDLNVCGYSGAFPSTRLWYVIKFPSPAFIRICVNMRPLQLQTQWAQSTGCFTNKGHSLQLTHSMHKFIFHLRLAVHWEKHLSSYIQLQRPAGWICDLTLIWDGTLCSPAAGSDLSRHNHVLTSAKRSHEAAPNFVRFCVTSLGLAPRLNPSKWCLSKLVCPPSNLFFHRCTHLSWSCVCGPHPVQTNEPEVPTPSSVPICSGCALKEKKSKLPSTQEDGATSWEGCSQPFSLSVVQMSKVSSLLWSREKDILQDWTSLFRVCATADMAVDILD